MDPHRRWWLRILLAIGPGISWAAAQPPAAEVQQVVPAPGEPVRTLVFSPDGRFMATGGEKGTVVLWQWPQARPLRTLQRVGLRIAQPLPSLGWGALHHRPDLYDSQQEVDVLAFSPSGPFLAASATGQKGVLLRLWEVPEGREIRLSAPKQLARIPPLSVSFSPDERFCFALMASEGAYESVRGEDQPRHRLLRIWETATGQERMDLVRPFLPEWRRWDCHPLGLLPGGRLITYADGRLALCDLVSGRETASARILPASLEHPPEALPWSFVAQGQRAAFHLGTTMLAVWDTASGEAPWLHTFERPGIRGLAFSSDGSRLILSQSGGTTEFLVGNLATRALARQDQPSPALRGRLEQPRALIAHSLAGQPRKSVLWDPLRGEEVFRLDLPVGQWTCAGQAPDGRHLIADAGAPRILILGPGRK